MKKILVLLLVAMSLYGYQQNYQNNHKSNNGYNNYKNSPDVVKLHFSGGKIVRIVGLNKKYGKEYRPFSVTLLKGNKIKQQVYSKGKYITLVFVYDNGIVDILSENYRLIASIDVTRNKNNYTINSGSNLYDFENVSMYVEKENIQKTTYRQYNNNNQNNQYNDHRPHKPNMINLQIRDGQIYKYNKWHRYRPINVSVHKGEAKNISVRLYNGSSIDMSIKYINNMLYINNEAYIPYSKEWKMGRDFVLHYQNCSQRYNTCETNRASFARDMLVKIMTKDTYR